MDNNLFRPIVTTETKIKAKGYEPVPGGLYFATDTKKIYITDGEDLLSMGGNSSIHYGVMKCAAPDTGVTEFTFTIDDIDGNAAIADTTRKKIPYVDDLIINVPELEEGEYDSSGLYRVRSINGEEIETVRLPIAASGGGGGGTGPGGGGSGRIMIKDLDGSAVKYFLSDETEAKLRFSVTSSNTENNYIVKMTYQIGSSITIEDMEEHDFGNFEFDLTPHLSKLSTSNQVTMVLRVEDAYGTLKSFNYYINVIELSLTSDIKDNILITDNGERVYYCTPKGGNRLYNRKVLYRFFNADGGHLPNLDQEVSVNTSGTEITSTLKFDEIGIYKMEVTYTGSIEANGDRPVNSNVLSYQLIYYGEEPILGAYMPKGSIMQYDTLNIDYILASTQDSTQFFKVTLTKNGDKVDQAVKLNQAQVWSIYFDKAGIYSLMLEDTFGNRQEFNNIIVDEYEGEMPVIDPSETELYLSALNRSNNEINKDTWSYNQYNCKFENFIWGTVNGWRYDEEEKLNALHLSSGAKLTIDNFYPYKQDAMSESLGQTIELDFKIKGTIDFEKPLIKCISRDNKGDIQVGFWITGQESTMNTEQIKATGGTITEGDDNQIYNTAIQGLTSKFVENKRIHLTWVVERKNKEYPLIITYLNGVLSGMTKYAKSDKMVQNIADPAKIIFDSTYANIDIYNIRVYNKPLEDKAVLDNYIATLATPDERVNKFHDNNDLLDNNNKISVPAIEAGGYTLSVPYIKITGGEALSKDDDGYKLNANDTTVQLPVAKKDYRLIKTYEFVDQNGNHDKQVIDYAFKDNGYLDKGVVMYGQGTSSMEYPVKNLRFKARGKDANGKKYKFKVNKDDCPVDLVCLKADFMESSGSHNTGTGNLVHSLMQQNGSDYLSPAQKHYDDLGYTVVTAIRGYPIALFYRKSEEDDYEYVGKYNFNLDKGTQEPFGFFPTPEEWPEDDDGNVIIPDTLPENSWGWASPEDTITSFPENKWINTIHCYEFLNNASPLANFLSEEDSVISDDIVNSEEFGGDRFKASFYTKVKNEDGDMVPNWALSYESRYPEAEEDDFSDVDIASWYRLVSWVNSCNVNDATEEDLETPYVAGGKEYTVDNAEYRLAKFKNEFTDYFDMTFTSVYYVLTDFLLMIDSRAKNMMIATWDNIHWYPIFYDMDTMLGLNNYGYNKFSYDVEDTDPNIYNGQNSVLWNNFRECFQNEINSVYNTLRKTGLNYNNLLKIYNETQADAMNEVAFNTDARYKYIRPFTEGYYNSVTGDLEWVKPGSVDYLYASQGRRSMHREWWLDNRLNYSDGKRLSEAYRGDRFIMRLYTPQPGESIYVPVEGLTADAYAPGKYYVQDEDSDGKIIYIIANGDFDSDLVYYELKAGDKLTASIEAVPPNNNFTITPLHNQYIAVAYGGSNGVTVGPIYTKANESAKVKAPGKYNDTETYIYGGSQLKDLGDLSSQYLGRFFFPDKSTKLEALRLGNQNPAYYNPNLSSLEIGSSAPYLKLLDITNCSGLGQRVLSISECPNLEYIHTIGSGITGIELPEHGVIKELYLPTSINSLTINDQTSLTDAGFRIRSSTTSTENDYSKLSRINLEKVPGLNSYEIVKNGTALQTYRLIDVDWKITDPDDIVNNTIPVLERMIGESATLLPEDPESTPAQSLTGTLTIECAVDDAYAIWERYWQTFPNLNFVFANSNIIDVNVYDGNGNIYWNKKLKKNTSITSTFFTDKNTAIGELTVPLKTSSVSHHYDFVGWASPINTTCVPEAPDLAIAQMVSYVNSNNSTVDKIEFKPKHKERIRVFNITFLDEDGSTKLKTLELEYNSILTPPNDLYPYKDSSDLPLEEKWAFIGYFDTMGRKLESQLIVSDMVYTAHYSKMSVYDDIIDDKYIYWNGNTLMNRYTEAVLRGKITLPLKDNVPVLINNAIFQYHHSPNVETGFAGIDTSKITHIFFEKDKTPTSVIIGDYAFNHCTGLKYIELPKNISVISQYTFYDIGASNIKYIGPKITDSDFKSLGALKVCLPNTITSIGQVAFGNTASNGVMNLGDKDNPWAVENLKKIDVNACSNSRFPEVNVYISSEEEIDEQTKVNLESAFNASMLNIIQV